MTLDEFKKKKEAFEGDGRITMGVRLTGEQARTLRRELHHLYGQDPGEKLTTLYGVEVLATDADHFELS